MGAQTNTKTLIPAPNTINHADRQKLAAYGGLENILKMGFVQQQATINQIRSNGFGPYGAVLATKVATAVAEQCMKEQRFAEAHFIAGFGGCEKAVLERAEMGYRFQVVAKRGPMTETFQ